MGNPRTGGRDGAADLDESHPDCGRITTQACPLEIGLPPPCRHQPGGGGPLHPPQPKPMARCDRSPQRAMAGAKSPPINNDRYTTRFPQMGATWPAIPHSGAPVSVAKRTGGEDASPLTPPWAPGCQFACHPQRPLPGTQTPAPVKRPESRTPLSCTGRSQNPTAGRK